MRRTLLVLSVCFALVLLTSCDFTPQDREMVRGFIEEWARSRNMHPMNDDGSINLSGLWNASSRFITGRSGDDEVDAVLDAVDMVMNLQEADKLMAEGRVKRDVGLMDQAIQSRPGDWTYRTSRAAVALEQNDVSGFQAQMDTAQQLIAERGIQDPLWISNRIIGDLEVAQATLSSSSFSSQEQCTALYTTLSQQYEVRAGITGSAQDQEKAQSAQQQAQQCPGQ